MITVAPEFHRGKVVTSGVQVEDVCATVCRLLGIKTITARSRQLKAAFR